jgi:hypothetical protein
MDFFDGLDNGHHAKSKKSILNGMTAGSVMQPSTLTEMYLLVNQWLKTTGSTQSILASTFVTKLDMPDIAKNHGKGHGQTAMTENETESKATEEKAKPKHDLSKVKCFICGKRGHITPNCPENDQEEETKSEKKQFVTWEDEQYEEDICKSGIYVTFEVYESMHSSPKFGKYDVLLDNQADVSIVHTCLLHEQ